MGACCSKDKMFQGFKEEDDEDYEEEGEEQGSCMGEGGAHVRMNGSCRFASMYTQQGRKGVNQDAMTLWKDFNGQSNMIFCGVFDGHGPLGHKVASHVRDTLPSKITSELESSKYNNHDDSVSEVENHDALCDEDGEKKSSPKKDTTQQPSPIVSWKASFIKAFEELDQELSTDSSIDSFCSGCTAVAILKQDNHLMVANLGDSRAVLCVRDKKNKPVPVQLTVDLKPNLPCEAERIKSCNGRVFAMDEEPDVYRLWLPEDDSPGLAMARAFGDFCLKDFGLISTPKLSYRKICSMDEFVVIATDGVWDVLTNKEVVKIVASVKKRSKAAKVVVKSAVRAWKTKYPYSKIDDCAVICFFLKPLATISKSVSMPERDMVKLTHSESFKSVRSTSSHESPGTEVADDEWNALDGVTRSNTVLKLPRFSTDGREKRIEFEEEQEYFVSM